MDNTKQIIQLADQIEHLLQDGFVLNSESLHFINSYFSISTADELEIQLKDDDFHRETLLEHIISPDEAFQEKLEHLIETSDFDKKDIDKISNLIISTTSGTHIIFPENSESVLISVPKDILNRFISKLRLHHKIPEKLVKTINSTVPDDLINAIKVKFRHSNLDFNNTIVQFFSLLIEKTSLLENAFFPCLEFSISVLEGAKTKKGLKELFQEKKNMYTQARNNIRQTEKLLKSSTMETVMLQGIHVPSVSVEDAEKKIRLADTILFHVFGFTDRMKNPRDVDLGEFSGDEDLHKIFRLLS